MFIFDREMECEWGGQRERETQNPKQAPSRLCAVGTQPDAGFNPTNWEVMP